ncbi:STAS domain-containing protein [Streptomyces sp. NPDC048057]|uniref:STAS domain-containing protein n=1 Tax=Streptomyces sp. NPDC048057 TaxID=3155628 RepID=UPI0033DF9CD2
MKPLEVSYEHVSDGTTVVSVEGEASVYTAPWLRAALNDLIHQGHVRLVVDLGKVDFLDSTGLGVILRGVKHCRAQGGALVVVITEARVGKILRTTGLIKVIPEFTTVARAIEALARVKRPVEPT